MPQLAPSGVIVNNQKGHICCSCNKLSNSCLIKIKNLFEKIFDCEDLLDNDVKTTTKFSNETFFYLKRQINSLLYNLRMQLETIKSDEDFNNQEFHIEREVLTIKNLLNELK